MVFQLPVLLEGEQESMGTRSMKDEWIIPKEKENGGNPPINVTPIFPSIEGEQTSLIDVLIIGPLGSKSTWMGSGAKQLWKSWTRKV